jgi:subtilisin family serine protease
MTGISGLPGHSTPWRVSDFYPHSGFSDANGFGWGDLSISGDRATRDLSGCSFPKSRFHACSTETLTRAGEAAAGELRSGNRLHAAYRSDTHSLYPVRLSHQVNWDTSVDDYPVNLGLPSPFRSPFRRPTPDSSRLAASPVSIRSPQATATLPVNPTSGSLETAQDLGTLSGSLVLNDFVGTADPNDYYRFTLATTSDFSLSLTNLTADADVQLLNGSGTLIARSATSGTSPESIIRTLATGTYYIRVYQFRGDTNYTLSLSATRANLGADYSSDFGYGLVNAAAAVAQALGQPAFPAVASLGGTHWGLDLMNVPEVWAMGYTGQGITVAVVDSGVDYNHPDLRNNIWVNAREIPGNGIDDDGNGYIDDVQGWDFINNDNTPSDLYGHGTHIAGIIAAANNGSGVTGVAYNAQIMPVRVLDEAGFGNYAEIAAGIRYAANNGAHVINLSLGGMSVSNEISTAIQYATGLGAVVVISSGNGGASQPSFPANLTHQWGTSVGAIDSNQQIASFSNRAGAAVVNYVVAPGVSIYSTTPNNTYQYYSGTSMAAPYVAGVAALILSANPALTPAQVVSLLTSTANPGAIRV